MYAQPWNAGGTGDDHNGKGVNQQHPPLTRRQKIVIVIIAVLSFAIAYYGAGIYYLVHDRDACSKGAITEQRESLDSTFWVFTLLHVTLFTFGSMAIRMYNFPYGFMFPTMKQNLMQLVLSTVFVIYESVLLLTPRVTCQGEYYSGLYVWMW